MKWITNRRFSDGLPNWVRQTYFVASEPKATDFYSVAELMNMGDWYGIYEIEPCEIINPMVPVSQVIDRTDEYLRELSWRSAGPLDPIIDDIQSYMLDNLSLPAWDDLGIIVENVHDSVRSLWHSVSYGEQALFPVRDSLVDVAAQAIAGILAIDKARKASQ